MSAPIINPTTSILGFKLGETWEYQPFLSGAGGTVTWACTGLPAGMSIDTSTGLISGAATVAGVFNATLGASDTVNGAAVPIPLTIGIEPASTSSGEGIGLFVDVISRQVTLNGPAVPDGQPLFSVKQGDSVLFKVQFQMGGTVVDRGTLGRLDFVLKELEPDVDIVTGGGAPTGSDGTPMAQTGSGSSATYIIAVVFDSELLTAALANYESDQGTSFTGLAQLKWTETNTTSGPRVGAATLSLSSQTFLVQVVRNLES